jgi:hypothetical protein
MWIQPNAFVTSKVDAWLSLPTLRRTDCPDNLDRKYGHTEAKKLEGDVEKLDPWDLL